MSAPVAAELYASYREKVMGFFLSRLRSREDAEDLCSEVFLNAIRALPDFDETKASLSTWLYTISRNTLTDHLRRQSTWEELSPEPLENASAQAQTVREDTLRELAAALRELDREQRDIVILHYYNGYSLVEVAERMGLSYGAVKLRHTKALEALRRELIEE